MKKGDIIPRNESGQISGGSGKPDRYSIDEVAEALEIAHGVLTQAGRYLGCTARTVRRYLERYPELKEVREEARISLLDLAESQLVRKIEEGNMTGIIFLLKCQGKGRGYIERGQLELSGTVKTGAGMPEVDAEALAEAVSRLIRGEPEKAPQGGQ